MIKTHIKGKQDDTVLLQVLFDCAVSMWAPVLLTAAMEMAGGILGVVTADTLGEFADAAFALDIRVGAGKFFFWPHVWLPPYLLCRCWS